MKRVHDTILMKCVGGRPQPFPHEEMIKAKCMDEGKAVYCLDASKAGCLKCSEVSMLNLSFIFQILLVLVSRWKTQCILDYDFPINI